MKTNVLFNFWTFQLIVVYTRLITKKKSVNCCINTRMTVRSTWLLFNFFHSQIPYVSSEFIRALRLLFFAWNKPICCFSNQNFKYVDRYSTVNLEWRRSHVDFLLQKQIFQTEHWLLCHHSHFSLMNSRFAKYYHSLKQKLE